MGNGPLYWGIFGLALLVIFIIVSSSGENFKKEPYSWILLISILAFSTLKFFYEKYGQIILIDGKKIISKTLLGETFSIAFTDIKTVMLEKQKGALIISNEERSITISLKIKDWEDIVEILEDNLAEEKFINFE